MAQMVAGVKDQLLSTSKQLLLSFQLYHGLPSLLPALVTRQKKKIIHEHTSSATVQRLLADLQAHLNWHILQSPLVLAMSVFFVAELCIGKAVILRDST